MSTGGTDRELIENMLDGDLASLADEVRAAVLPSIKLVRARDASDAIVGRLGGNPRLAADDAWPRWKDRALAFLAEIDLAAVRSLDEDLDLLPTSGFLSFFFCADPDEQPWGFDPHDRGSGRVIYRLEGRASRTRALTEAPW